ncbi:efflux RND transporter periplasmic adaptor subunit [Nonomuraea sp. NPDC059194]|uniref:efflux RND transporter periplasmic adaptor subunit n=1 Tax=Nonomuraea sp. NPDC059194 TaxID=3346764 RepID=UPI0036B343C6
MRPSHIRRGALAVAATALVGAGVLVVALGDDPTPLSTVRLAAAQRGTVTASVSAAGNTRDGSRRDLAFGASGKVQGLKVKVGDRVRKGRLLAWVDATAAREAYTAAKADVAAAQDALDSAGSCSAQTGGAGAGITLTAFTPATALLTPSPDPGSPDPGSPDPGEPEEPVPTVTVTVTAPAPTVTVTVTATPPSQTSDPRPNGRPSTAPRASSGPGGQDKADCGMSEEQAESALAKAQAAEERAADAVRSTRIVAPASGTVLSVAGARGDSTGTGTFISLGDLDELQVQAMFTESDVNSLALGQKARVTLATRQGERHSGTVTHIAPTATASGRLVRYAVTVTFDDPPADLLVGQTATVTVTTGEADDALYVPAQAVRTRADGSATVTVKTASGQKEQPVTTGVRGDQYVQIEAGLSDDDQVVLGSSGTGEFPDGSWPES